MAARIELQLLAAIMSAPAGSLPQNSDDPIFALIQAHRQANIARAVATRRSIARTMFTTEPTTVAGVAALMTYVVELSSAAMAGLLIGTGRCRFTVRLRVRSRKFMNGLLHRLITPTQLESTATDDDGSFLLPHRHNYFRSKSGIEVPRK